MLLIQEALALNVSLGTDYPDKDITRFSSVPPGNLWASSLKTDHGSFQIISHSSFGVITFDVT